MNKFRLTFDVEIPSLSKDDKEAISMWLDNFIKYTEEDIYSCCPRGGMNVSSNWEEINDCKEI